MLKLPLFKNAKKAKKRRKFSHPDSEHTLQKTFFDYIAKKHPKIRPLCFSIPNEAANNLRIGTVLKQRGLTKGIPDVFCAIPSTLGHGVFIEFKKGKNTLSDAQEDSINHLRKAGYACYVCYDLDAAIDYLEEHIIYRVEGL